MSDSKDPRVQRALAAIRGIFFNGKTPYSSTVELLDEVGESLERIGEEVDKLEEESDPD